MLSIHETKNNIMNKMNKFLSVIAIVFLGTLASCVQDDDYGIPPVAVSNTELVTNTNIGLIKDMFTGNLVSFSGDNAGLIVSGYVVSNDESGNFYKTLIIQDAPENPTAAIQIDVDVTSLFSFYKPGRKIYIKLDGLGMDEQNGVLHIGEVVNGEVERISSADYQEYIVRSSEVAVLTPMVITPAEFSDDLINMLVQIDDMQLRSEDLGSAYANVDNTFSVNRYLKNCTDESETILRNSGFSDFKNQLFPEGRGSITAVFSKYNSSYQLFIRDTEDVDFTENRCDPVFEETFSDAIDGSNLNNPGWINYAEEGGELWTEQVYSGNGYAEFSAFNSGDASNIGWLISPGIDMDAQDGEMLSFQTEYAYPDAGHYPLEVFISTDFDGTEAGIATATWEPVMATIAHPDNTPDWFTWVDSGNIDISGYSGTLYVAFKYTGSDTANQNSTIHVENVKVFVP